MPPPPTYNFEDMIEQALLGKNPGLSSLPNSKKPTKKKKKDDTEE